jgi:hypothetical protein
MKLGAVAKTYGSHVPRKVPERDYTRDQDGRFSPSPGPTRGKGEPGDPVPCGGKTASGGKCKNKATHFKDHGNFGMSFHCDDHPNDDYTRFTHKEG